MRFFVFPEFCEMSAVRELARAHPDVEVSAYRNGLTPTQPFAATCLRNAKLFYEPSERDQVRAVLHTAYSLGFQVTDFHPVRVVTRRGNVRVSCAMTDRVILKYSRYEI